MDGEGDLPLHRHLPHRGVLRRLDPVVRNTRILGFANHLGIVGVEEDLLLRGIEVPFPAGFGGAEDAIGVVEHHAHVADPPDAGFGAGHGHARLHARITEDALLRLAGLPVEVDLLVGTCADTHPPTAAAILIDEHDAILLTLVDGAGGAGRHAGRIQAVVAEPRQVHVEGLLEVRIHLLLDAFEVLVLGTLLELARQVILPVRPPVDLLHPLAGDLRYRARSGSCFG